MDERTIEALASGEPDPHLLMLVRRCADCKHVIRTVDEEDPTDVGFECGYRVPFWVPLPVADYGRWVGEDEGAKCSVFDRKG